MPQRCQNNGVVVTKSASEASHAMPLLRKTRRRTCNTQVFFVLLSHFHFLLFFMAAGSCRCGTTRNKAAVCGQTRPFNQHGRKDVPHSLLFVPVCASVRLGRVRCFGMREWLSSRDFVRIDPVSLIDADIAVKGRNIYCHCHPLSCCFRWRNVMFLVSHMLHVYCM